MNVWLLQEGKTMELLFYLSVFILVAKVVYDFLTEGHEAIQAFRNKEWSF